MSLIGPQPVASAEGEVARSWLETADGERTIIRGVCSVGRSATNHLVLPGEKVSRNHALVQMQGADETWLTDVGSVNGTYLNGQRITRATRLYDGDLIGLGPHRLTFRQPGGPPRSRADFSVAEMTISDVETENCWLLLVQGDSMAQPNGSGPNPAPPSQGLNWLDRCRDVVEERGGKINRYTEDGFLAYWRDRQGSRAGVCQALRSLAAFQASTSRCFRFVVHYAQINIGHPVGGQEILSGGAINFAFRVERLARTCPAANLITEVAQALLQASLPFQSSGRHSLPGIEGVHAFYSVPSLGS